MREMAVESTESEPAACFRAAAAQQRTRVRRFHSAPEQFLQYFAFFSFAEQLRTFRSPKRRIRSSHPFKESAG